MSQAPVTQLTLHEIYNYPNLSGDSFSNPAWSPDGRYFAYIRADRNGIKTEIWAYDVTSDNRKMLFDFARILGGELSEQTQDCAGDGSSPIDDWRDRRIKPETDMSFQWSPDAKELLISVAGKPPHLLEIDTAQLLPLTQDETPTRDAQFSPNGQCVSFVRGWDLYMIDANAPQYEIPITYGSSVRPSDDGRIIIGDQWDASVSRPRLYVFTPQEGVDHYVVTDLFQIDDEPIT